MLETYFFLGLFSSVLLLAYAFWQKNLTVLIIGSVLLLVTGAISSEFGIERETITNVNSTGDGNYIISTGTTLYTPQEDGVVLAVSNFAKYFGLFLLIAVVLQWFLDGMENSNERP